MGLTLHGLDSRTLAFFFFKPTDEIAACKQSRRFYQSRRCEEVQALCLVTKGPEEREREREAWSPPPPFLGEGSGQRAGVGEVWGVEWDQLVTSGRKNVPVCSVGPLP